LHRTFALLIAAAAFTGSTNAQQPVIRVVANAASRIGPGLPGYGVARGSIFAITGTGLGPDTAQVSSFPLATTLAGTSVQVGMGDAAMDCLVVSTSGTLVLALLPSTAPSGDGVVTVTYYGQAG
jgi:uncharacterized protein (TIGR03437 family)